MSRIRLAVKRAAHQAGYDIRRRDEFSTMDAALGRIAKRHGVSTVVDIGASDGRWSVMAMQHFPGASFLLIEAQPIHAPALEALARRDSRIRYVVAAAGDRVGSIHFDTSDPFGGAAAPEPFGESDALVPMTSVDDAMERLGLTGPVLMKLDTHGFEQEILTGATRTLEETNVLIIEAYNFVLRSGALRFDGLINHVETLGFRPVDLVEVLRRPSDLVLWQMDLIFARDDHPVFRSDQYA